MKPGIIDRSITACFVAWLTTLSASANLTVSNLRCEYLVSPLGIDIAQPRLSWQIRERELKSGTGGQRPADRGLAQAAYQILVATKEELLKEDKGDLWDSGKVASGDSQHIEYAGKLLKSGQQCFWKVKSWINSAGSSRATSVESKHAMWCMGLLTPEDIKAKWIGSPTDVPVEPAPLLRKSFSIGKKVKRATVYVSGLGYYELSLNGKKVGDHVLDPKFTRYDKRVLYVTYDITTQLKSGANAIGVMLGNGWYNYHVNNAWDFDTAPWRAKPKMLLQVEVEFADGTTQMVTSDDSWKYSCLLYTSDAADE